jgi:aspartate/methionine/tyrosine aminotransferase
VPPPLLLTKFLIHSGFARLFPSVQRRLGSGVEQLRYYSDDLLVAPHEVLEQVGNEVRGSSADVLDLTAGSPWFDLLPLRPLRLPAEQRGWPPPEGLLTLRLAVAEYLLACHELGYHPERELLITAGGLGAVHTALDAFVNRGDRVTLFDPCSPLYPFLLQARGLRLRWIPSWVEEGWTRFHLPHLDQALRSAKLLVLNSPCNPTGGLLRPEDVEQIAWWAQRRDVLILSDEVFASHASDHPHVSIAALPRAHHRTLVVGSLSKSHALTGARVGWLAGYEHLLRPCQAAAGLRNPFISTHCQLLALQALEVPAERLQKMGNHLLSRRQAVFNRLKAAGLKPTWPAAGFFLWVPVGDLGVSGREFATRLLTEKRVRVTPGDLFGPSGSKHIRLSFAGEEGRLFEGLTRLVNHVRQGRAGAKENRERVAV